MLEIKKNTGLDDNNKKKVYVTIDEIDDDESYLSGDSLHLEDEEAIECLCSYTFREVGEHFSDINFQIDEISTWNGYAICKILCRTNNNETMPSIKLDLHMDWESWNYPWSMIKFVQTFKNNVEKSDWGILFRNEFDFVFTGFGIEYRPTNFKNIINLDLHDAKTAIESVLAQTVHELLLNLNENSVPIYFQFPEEFKVASKQYLIYFAQFLADLGISADTEIKESLNKTLFKITPKDGKESLDKIYEALSVYLNIPGNNDAVKILSHNNDVASSQLQANVLHLQSQLILAQSTIQQKNTTIEYLKLTNFEYSSKALEDNPKSKNIEPLVKGVISLKDYEGRFGVIHFAEMLRTLKRKLS